MKIWNKDRIPERVLFIRLQALGDMTITLPYIQGFKQLYPSCVIDFMTREEIADVAVNLELFDHVYTLKGGRKTWRQAMSALAQFPRLYRKRYDVVIDLQNNWISKIVRVLLSPDSWSEFDRFSPVAAGERTTRTINAIGLRSIQPVYKYDLKNKNSAHDLLLQHGWRPSYKLVVLNPAGFLETRNWPLENYVKFAELWTGHFPDTQFLMLGIERMRSKAAFIRQYLGEQVLDLVGQTSTAEAFAIMQQVDLVISEDSGLMHMAWVSGKATVALFGSSRSDWSRPLGEHTICLNSSDLECGECMLAQCKFGDVRCLTRYTPEKVFNEARKLISRTAQ